MTHEELLANIDAELATDYEDAGGNFPIGLKALRAVVELHKPDIRGNCDICSWIIGGIVLYSVCPTIKAIEKELK